MRRPPMLTVCGCACLALLAFTIGCPTQTPDPAPGDTELTATEEAATRAAVDSAENIAQSIAPIPSIAVNTVSPPTGKPSTHLDFGTCPVTSVNLLIDDDPNNPFTFTLASNFSAAGCQPEGEGSFTCSGVLTGTLEFLSKSINFTFGGLTCAGRTLEGMAVLTYALLSDTQVSADGTLDVTATRDNEKTEIDGQVDTTYDLTNQSTTIISFTGVVSDGVTQRNCTMSNCVVRFKTGQNFIPGSGTMQLTGDRTILITFDASSPTTGIVQVSINGGPAFAVNVNDL